MPYTKRPITITTKLGANAVTSAPTRYMMEAVINSLRRPKIQISHCNFIRKSLIIEFKDTVPITNYEKKKLTKKVGNIKSQD